jgi:hypothetical protein
VDILAVDKGFAEPRIAAEFRHDAQFNL